MKSIFVITMWSGGRPAKKWESLEAPEMLANGAGVAFTSRHTKLPVHVIGTISVEEYESGKEELEAELSDVFDKNTGPPPEFGPRPVDDNAPLF